MEHTNAAFRLLSYRFPTFTFDITKQPDSTEEGDVAIRLGFVPRGFYSQAARLFKLVVDVEVLVNEVPLCKICCEAIFEFVSELKKEDLPDYFYPNSIAIVYPYIRAFCSLMTTQSNNTGIILPVLNLTSFGEKLKRNTILQEDDTDN